MARSTARIRTAATEGLSRAQLAEMVARNTLVFVRKARREGFVNRVTPLALLEMAESFKLYAEDDYSLRSARRLVVKMATEAGELDLLDLPALRRGY